jgi:hypothetical protein
VLGQQHFLRENAGGLTQPGGIERLKPFVDEVTDVRAAARPVVTDWLARQIIAAAPLGSAWSAVGHAG